VTEETRYSIEELAQLGGVSRRTVRFYVQEALIPAPLGLGRGRHYGPDHLARLLQVKALQEQGHTLEEIRVLAGGVAVGAAGPVAEALPRSLWRRLAVAPGVEVHVNSEIRLPSPGRLQELADWCQAHFGRATKEDEGGHD